MHGRGGLRNMPDKTQWAKFNLDYDRGEDLLYIYNPAKKSKGSVEFGELVVDLEKEGGIAGLEIFGASKYLSELTNRKITKESIGRMDGAKISLSTGKGTTVIRILLLLEKEEVPAAIAIQNVNYRSPAGNYSN